MSQFIKPDIIVVEPSGQQKRFILKPHGELEGVKKKWRSHLRNVGAKWVDKQSHWTIAKENLKDFEKIKKLLDNDSKESPESTNKKSSTSSKSSESSSESDSEDSSDSDIELIDYLKNKIKTARGTHPEIESSLVDESDHEDVVSICRRLRHIYKTVNQMRLELKAVQEENAFLYREIEKLK